MAAVSQKIPNLLGGVSQQPDPVKLPGQVREAENVYLDPTFGCRKRPGTQYIATLADDMPDDVRWFSIFRDNNERYAVALYTNPSLVIRVWDLNDGSERSVSLSASAESYFSGSNQSTIEQITIADYTLITNTQAEVSMNTDKSAAATKEALVTIDQVAYNTVYSIDIANDGDSAPSKVYRATGIEVIPGSYEVDDGGSCSNASAQTFTKSGTNGQTGLSFRLINQCSPYLVGGNSTQRKVKSVFPLAPPTNLSGARAKTQFDGFKGDWIWGFPLFECDVYDAVWQTRGSRTGQQVVDNYNGIVEISEEEVRSFSNAKYLSRYKVDAQLLNGGEGWRVGDTTTVSMGGKSFTVRVTSEAFVYAYNSAGTASFSTPSTTEVGALDIGAVVSGLTAAVNGITDYSAESTGNVIKISNTVDRDFNLSVRGGITNKAMTAIKGKANDVTELPPQCFDGFILKVNNTEDSDSDDYYVKFTTEAPGIPGAGSWEETVAPDIKTTLNSSTMPHALVRLADGSFTLDALNSDNAFGGWAPRQVGDETSNPIPTFVGRTISNLFFFSNRLGFLSEDAVIMSQPGDYFNFFSQSALTVSDADPIDITASSTIPAILKAAIGTAKGLLLFAERSQFLLSAQELVFSSSTVKLDEISNYFYRSDVLPLNSGVSVSFISEGVTYSKVMEMAVDSIENRPQVADITRVIPEYLPPNFEWGEVLPNNNMLVYGEGTNAVFVFKFFNNGDERQLAGWTKWTYPSQIKLFTSEDDLIYMVMYDGTKYILCDSELTDDPDDAPLDVNFSKFSPRIDVTLATDNLTVVPVVGDTEFSRVYIDPNAFIVSQRYTLINIDGPFKGSFVEPEVEFDDQNDPYLFVSNDLCVDGNFVVGCGYDTTVELPSIFVTSDNKADRVNIPQVAFMYLELYYSGSYHVTVSKLGYDDVTKIVEITPANVYDANAVPIAEIGTATIPLFSAGNNLKVTIKAPDPFPSSITGYSWEGTYSNRGIKTI